MKAIIVDDERLARKELKDLLSTGFPLLEETVTPPEGVANGE